MIKECLSCGYVGYVCNVPNKSLTSDDTITILVCPNCGGGNLKESSYFKDQNNGIFDGIGENDGQ